MEEKGQKIRSIIKYPSFCGFMLVCTVMFILYLLLPPKSFSDTENRFLAERPAVTVNGIKDGSFMEAFDTYTEEQLPFRDLLIDIKADTELILLKKENNNIVRGKDGYLFEKILTADKRLSRNEAIIENFAKNTDRDIYLGIVPNSFEILKDRVPYGLPEISEKEYIDSFYEELSRIGNVHTIDVYDSLNKAAARDDEQIYYRTDHHWTTNGAYEGYRAICEKMGLKPCDIDESLRESVPGFYGTYYAKYKGRGIASDEIIYYNIPVRSYTVNDGEEKYGLYDLKKAETYDKYAMFLHGNYGCGEIISGVSENDDTLVIFKDSYSNCLIPFLLYDYGRIIVVDLRYYGASAEELLNREADADILLLYNFSHLNEDNNFYKLIRGQQNGEKD
ncbi:MAG: hypothetical protein K6G22_09235 [Lachnospiraceae bacterium]|nr:hypothetical protein [Lachnospiraceae bacterium]